MIHPARSNDTRPLVLFVEDEVLPRVTLTTMLEREGFRVLAVCSAEEALMVLGAVPEVQVVLADVKLSRSGMNGFELARRVRDEHQVAVVVISGQVAPDDDQLSDDVPFLAKPVHRATLVHLIEHVAGRQPDMRSSEATACLSEGSSLRSDSPEANVGQLLTPRQQEVYALLVQGKSNEDIALTLGLTCHTVKVHVGAIYRRLGVGSRVEALMLGSRHLSGAATA